MKTMVRGALVAAALCVGGVTAPAAYAEDAPATAAAPVALPAIPEGQGRVIFWRPGTMVGWAIGCGVNEGTERISALGRGKYFILNVAPGTHGFNARSEARDDLTLEVESGETYYVKCTIRMGFMVGRPNLAPSTAEEFQEKFGDLHYVDADDSGPRVLPDPSAPAAAAPAAQ